MKSKKEALDEQSICKMKEELRSQTENAAKIMKIKIIFEAKTTGNEQKKLKENIK